MEKNLSKPTILHIKNKKTGVVYLYQDQHYWDSDKQQTRHVRRCMGKLDSKTQQPLYNHRYRSEQGLLQGLEKQRIASIQPVGKMLLLEKIFVQSKLRLHLKKVFSEEELAMIKALVFSLVSEDNHLTGSCNLEGAPFEPEKVKDLLKTLNKNRQGQFFESWNKGSSKTEYLLYDLSSEASYKSHNPFLYYGHNRDKGALEQNNMVVVTNRWDGRPCNYTVLGGTMQDIPTLDILPLRMGLLSLERTTLVLNRVFYSRNRILSLLEQDQRFLIRVPSQKRWISSLISEHKQAIGQGPTICTGDGTRLQGISVPVKGYGLVHIYYDASWRGEQRRNLSNILFACKSELLENNLVEEHQRLYDKYFEVKYSSKGYRSVLYRNDPQEVFDSSHAGYWALLTNCEDTPQQALHTYLTRNHLEAEWDDMKSEEDCRLLEVHDPYIFSGRAFLQFLSLVMTTYMDSFLAEHGRGGYRGALTTMASYAKVSYESLMHESFTVPTAEQREIASLFKLKIKG